jgi:hypothetical protein
MFFQNPNLKLQKEIKQDITTLLYLQNQRFSYPNQENETPYEHMLSFSQSSFDVVKFPFF